MKFLGYFLILIFGAAGGWYARQAYVAHPAPAQAPTRAALARQAAAGNAEAAYQLGEMYLTTQGGAAEPSAAVEYLRLAAWKNFAPPKTNWPAFMKKDLPA